MPGLRTNPAPGADETTASQRFRRRLLAAVAVAVLIFLAVSGPRLGAFTPDLGLDYHATEGTDGGAMTVTLVLTNDGRLHARIDRILVDAEDLPFPAVEVSDGGKPIELPEMLSAGESIDVHVTWDEFDCARARTDTATVEVRAKPFLPFKTRKDVAVHGHEGNPDLWLANATREACGE